MNDISAVQPVRLAWTSGSAKGAALHQAIHSQLISGGAIAPDLGAPGGKSKFPTFVSATFVAVTVSLSELSAEAVLNAAFTQRYCSVAAFAAGDGPGVCVLAMELPEVEKDASRYALLQAGLEARYRGSRRSIGAIDVYLVGRGADAEVFGQALDARAVRELLQLGQESKELQRQPDEMKRSRLFLELASVITLSDQDEAALTVLPKGVAVFCPIHADDEATAQTFRLTDGRPGLACMHCRRTYTVRDASNDYDFGTFDRTVRELAQLEHAQPVKSKIASAASQFDIRSERYLGHLALQPGVLCVKSPKGSGKTEQLVNVVAQCRQMKKRVLLVGHRRTLLTAMADRLNLTCYITPANKEAARQELAAIKLGKLLGSTSESDDDSGGDFIASAAGGMKRNKPSGRYAISLDSLSTLDPGRHQYSVVIIDECEQVFAHLVGGTLREKRREVYHRLRHYLRVAESVVLLDADLGMVTMDSLFAMRLMDDVSVRFVLNEYQRQSDSFKMYETQAQLVARIHQAIHAGEKCYVATNSKNKVIELQKSFELTHPSRRIVAVHSDNSSSAETQLLLSNIGDEFERRIDVLIASPALGTGVDITFKGHHHGMDARTVVDHAFGLFVGRVTTHMDMDQQLMRVRQPGAVHVWVDPAEEYFETDVGAIKQQLVATVGEARTTLGFNDDGTPILAPEDGLIDIWARVRAASRGSKNRLSPLFRQQRLMAGFHAEDVPQEPDSMKLGAQSMKDGKRLRMEDRSASILAAKVIDAKTADDLVWRDKNGAQLSPQQRAELERYRIERFYCEPVSEELIELDGGGRLRQPIRNLEYMLATDAENLTADKQEREGGVWAADLNVRHAKAMLLREVLQTTGVFDLAERRLKEDADVEQSTLAPFVAELRKLKDQFQSVFELVPRKDADSKRVQQLSAVLDIVGLRLAQANESDAGGKKVRRYRLDASHLERICSIMNQRAVERDRRSA